MANETDLELVAENKLGIQRNKKRIFELEAGVSTTFAELMLLLADIGENRALLDRNFASSFTGNRAIAIDNVDDLFNSRLLMIESLEPQTEVEKNFQTMFSNLVKIDQLENRAKLNDKLSEICARVQEINPMLQAINKMIAEANETVVEQADEMISENAEWVDGALLTKMDAATANANKQGVSNNLERLEKLIEKSGVAKEESTKILKRVNEVTRNILESGEDIAKRREAIQADRERVVANQRRTAEMIIKG